ETRHYVSQTLRDIEAAVAAQPPGTTVFLANEESPKFILGAGVTNFAFPGRAAVFLITHPSSDMLNGRRVRFVEPDLRVRAMLSGGAGRRRAQRLVAPEALSARP